MNRLGDLKEDLLRLDSMIPDVLRMQFMGCPARPPHDECWHIGSSIITVSFSNES